MINSQTNILIESVMKIIPVIDIKKSQVVHAIKGQREQYHAIKSTLCNGCDPVKIVSAILNLYPFPVVYIADLDAISGNGNNNEIITAILDDNPQLTLWLDSGITKADDVMNKNNPAIINVIGTETVINKEEILEIKNHSPESILSLDFAGNQFLGDKDILNSRDTWQENVIVMVLNRVGGNTGPDIELANRIKQRNKNKKVYLAGGIANISHLEAIKKKNIDGALIATSIHTGKITANEIKNVLEAT